MALIKTPGGEFYVDSSEFTIDYDENVVRLVGGGVEGEGDYLPLAGGTMDAGATIQGEDELVITVPDSGESASVGVTPEGVTLIHNTNSDADASVRVIENSVEIKGGDTTVAFNSTGVNFGAGAITNINSIGGGSGEIAFESNMDMNNHQISNLADPVNNQDAVTKHYADTTYLKDAGPDTKGLVKQGVAVPDAAGTTDTALTSTVNALLASLRAAGIIAE